MILTWSRFSNKHGSEKKKIFNTPQNKKSKKIIKYTHQQQKTHPTYLIANSCVTLIFFKNQ